MTPATLTLEQARRGLLAAQRLSSTVPSVAEALHAAGPVRTLGGVEAYLALRARVKGLEAADVHAAVGAGDAQVMPALRGCMYVVGREHAPLLRWLAGWLGRPKLEREREKAGVRPGELERLGDRVIEALRTEGPQTTDGLKKVLPKDAVRALGDAGKKVGLSTTLPSTLRLLEWDARVTRRPERDRLDNERYVWRATPGWVPLQGDPEELLSKVAALFFRWAGTSTVEAFAEWAGVGLREARAATGPLGLETLEVEGLGKRLALPGDLPGGGQAPVVLLGFEDNLLALQGGAAPLVDVEYHGLQVPSWGEGEAGPLGQARRPYLRPVVVAGRIVGFWDFDPDARQVAWGVFDPAVDAATHDRIEARARDLSKFLADDVGHGRSLSLDTDETLRERAAWVRALRPPRKKAKGKAAAPKAPAAAPAPKKAKAGAKKRGKPQRTA